jgi:hypothetical protein
MEIGSGPPLDAQIEVIKKATEVQEQAVSQLLEDSAAQLKQQNKSVQQTQQDSGANLTGIGTGLDVTA